ncbi:MAG: glycosyltransferase [Bacteroidales bacterium]|nr:glycosyltransferase [Bacteroidales bacterium]
MTISILIPTYNYNACKLVIDMHEQAKAENIDAEVLVGDDASTSETEWMKEVEAIDGIRVLHSEKNVGRACIRNMMAKEAKGKWLLFVDADAQLPPQFSLKKSLDAGFGAPVVCGGLYHPSVNPNPDATLRYKYERNADSHRSAEVRNRRPHRQLSTFNLLVRRDVFMNIRFDEHLKEYGYEDTLFGVRLGYDGIPVAHIDNPLIHVGMDTNAEFLHKTETAMHALKRIYTFMPRDYGIMGAVSTLERWHMIWAMRGFYQVFRKPMRYNLLSKHPNLFIFKLYKLGYFLSIE